MFKYIVLALSVAVYVEGYSVGAPESACVDMVPGHGVPPRKEKSPYTITTSTKIVKAGSPMEVVISTSDPTKLMKGILLQARDGDKPIGTFTLAPNDNFAQLLNCGTPGNAVTHKHHEAKDDKQTESVVWTPPADFNGEIKFRATIVQNFENFWVGVESAPIKVTN
uniref:Venom peptide n=1 Tax=Comana monomorpha TaxID=1555636 RepID=A0AAU6PAZ2_9NEOP